MPAVSVQAAMKVPLLNAEMEVELAKRIEAGLFSDEKLAKGGKLSPKTLDEFEWIAEVDEALNAALSDIAASAEAA